MRIVVTVVTTTAAALLLVVAVVVVRGAGVAGDGRVADDKTLSRPAAEADGSTTEVVLRPRSPHQFATLPVVEDLPKRAVLRLRVVGFDEFDQATARQCRTAAGETRCGNSLPVQFGPDGTAVFQYLVTPDFADQATTGDEGCSPDQSACLVVVTSLDGQRRAEVQTVFGGRLPPAGLAAIQPAGGVQHGQVVTVTVTGLPPGTNARVTTCVAPSTSDERRCGSPAPTASMSVGPDGTGHVQLAVTRGPVGTQGLPCDDEHACVIAVLGDQAAVRVEPVPIVFAALPGAVYDPIRFLVGITGAISLFGCALWLVRRTDWSPVGEAAAPEIDDAVYADLDAIVAALPPEGVDAAPER